MQRAAANYRAERDHGVVSAASTWIKAPSSPMPKLTPASAGVAARPGRLK
jgi:hypothetical protein